MLQDAKNIKCNSYDEMIWKIRYWDGDEITLLFPNACSGWFFSYRVFMTCRSGSWYAYIDKILHGRHPNTNVDLSKNEVHAKNIRGRDREQLVKNVLDFLRTV